MARKRAKKRGGKWVQASVERMQKRGTLGSYGHHTVKQMERDKKKGGKIAKKATWALNMERAAKKRKKKSRTTTR